METKWLEDFVSLAETRSFSRSAQLRHVTQPAFSRRIQALEGWAGTDLVDRSSYPTRLTPAGQTLYSQAIEMLQGLQSTRAMLRGHSATSHDVIEFAVPHTLALNFFPAWVSTLREHFGPMRSRLLALNVHDAMLRLIEGGCDLLIAYQHPSQPLQLDAGRYETVRLGSEVLAAYAKAGSDGQPLFRLPGRAGERVPFLSYASGAYMARMVDVILKQAGEPLHLESIYETDMSEGLKAMALEGHGIAFLPQNAVRKEVRQRTLVSALPPEIGHLEATLEIRAYRARPIAATPKPARASGRGTDMQISHGAGSVMPMSHGSRAVDTLWAHLLATQPPATS